MDIPIDRKSTAHRFARGIIVLALMIFGLLSMWLITFVTGEKVSRIPFTHVTLHPAQRGTFTDMLVTALLNKSNFC